MALSNHSPINTGTRQWLTSGSMSLCSITHSCAKLLQNIPHFDLVNRLLIVDPMGAGKSTFTTQWIKEFDEGTSPCVFHVIMPVETDVDDHDSLHHYPLVRNLNHRSGLPSSNHCKSCARPSQNHVDPLFHTCCRFGVKSENHWWTTFGNTMSRRSSDLTNMLWIVDDQTHVMHWCTWWIENSELISHTHYCITIAKKSNLKNIGCVTDFWIYESMRDHSFMCKTIAEYPTLRSHKPTAYCGSHGSG